MKTIFYLALIMAAGSILNTLPSRAATNRSASLKEDAETYVEAYLNKDYETCLRMMGGEIVSALGGKVAVLNHYHATEEALKLHHMTLETIEVGDPGPVIAKDANEQFVVIPEKHYYMAREGQYVLNSYILAVSDDGGQSWNMLEGSWRISEHIKNHDLALYGRLKLPTRKIYQADDPRIMMVEKGGGFVTPPETIKYKQSLRQRDNPPSPPPKRTY